MATTWTLQDKTSPPDTSYYLLIDSVNLLLIDSIHYLKIQSTTQGIVWTLQDKN